MMLLQSASEWRRHGYALDLLATGPREGPVAEMLRGVGYTTHHIPFRSKLRYLPSRHFAPHFLALCRSRRYHLLHLHTEAAMPLFVALGRLAGIPAIVRTVHNTFTFTGPLGLRKRMERKLARAVGVRFAFVSESVEQVEAEYFGNHGTYTPNWFDTTHFRPPSAEERAAARATLGCPDGTTVIVSVGNCGEAKNHPAFLRALAEATPRGRLLYLHVGLERPGREERRLASELGLDASVRFEGSHPDPRIYLWAADIFVMPSLREGLSIAALEAVGAGTPALFTNVRGLRDIADKTRWITQVEPAHLRDGLNRCLELPPEQARERALEDSATIHREFSIESGVGHIIRALYRDARPYPTAAAAHPDWQP